MKAKVIQLAARVKQWLTYSPASMIGIDIGSGMLKIAEITWRNNLPTLTAAGLAALPADLVRDGIILDRQVMAETFRQLLATAGVTGRHAVISVSGHAVFIRELTFPAMTEEELRQAIRWDLDKYIPADAENYYFDFAVVGTGKLPHEVRVLLVAAPQSMIDAVTAICKEAGLKPMAIDIEPLAIARTFTAPANFLVVDIGQKLCQLTIFQANCPVVSRLIPLGGDRYTDVIRNLLALDYNEAELLKQRQRGLLHTAGGNEPAAASVHRQLLLLVEELSREIRRTADYYQAQNREAVIDRILLTGGGACMDNLAGNLAAQLGGVEVTRHNPLGEIGAAKSFDAEWLQAIAPQLTVAVGLAVRGGEGY
ncbi:type IV pilus assembly protein PilM [Sporomusa termitida]|uniref:Cell division protein FtsA n=1 Tax=Sporomusa termitida TaxID=2377 RepID=A0A517DSL1_9FIRM|nr:type IV pilus assembly protein PilM [Sporomusa termitida]QDR80329.1 Cell division protein FtsA [Sporomusa termitida]